MSTTSPQTIRRAVPDDAAALVGVLASVAEEGRWIATEAPVDVPARTATMREEIAAGADVLWAVEEDGVVVGIGGLHPTGAAGVGALGMALAAAARGRGGGKLMMRTILAHAEASGLHKVELEVWPENGRAIALYATWGFAVEGVRRDHYRRRDGTLRSAVLMARHLAG